MLEFLTGAGLASAAGLNAYIPLLVVGLLNRYTDIIVLPEGWDWLSEPLALVIMSALLLVEILADKIPAIDHLNDTLGTVIRPTAGGLAFGASSQAETVNFSEPSEFFSNFPWVALVSGALIALIVHLGKMSLRVVVNALTFGLGAPVVSSAEDGASVGISLIAILVPLLVIAAFVGMIVLYVALRWRQKSAPTVASP